MVIVFATTMTQSEHRLVLWSREIYVRKKLRITIVE
jgi:hypothetical protein